jgi:hypothetical protein
MGEKTRACFTEGFSSRELLVAAEALMISFEALNELERLRFS